MMAIKRANGTGSIVKLKGKRRKPWRVRVTLGWDMDMSKGQSVQVVKILGDFETRILAEEALLNYLSNPYKLEDKDMTFEQLYKEWSDWYYTHKCSSKTSIRTLQASYAYCTQLYKMRVRDIKAVTLERCIETAYVIPASGKGKGEKRAASASTKGRIKSLFNLMFDFAVKHDIVQHNCARDFGLSEEVKKERREKASIKVPFSYNEVMKMWENVDSVRFIDMILIGIYSGLRPQELASLKLENVNLQQEVFLCGMKTSAGKNRYVPIHKDILDLVSNRYNDAVSLESTYLFNDVESQTDIRMTYDKYRSRFNKVMTRLGMRHSPHETRHTFVTVAKLCRLDENILKLIVGHSIVDVTERVYTHRTLLQLKEEMKKFVITSDMDVDLPFMLNTK